MADTSGEDSGAVAVFKKPTKRANVRKRTLDDADASADSSTR